MRLQAICLLGGRGLGEVRSTSPGGGKFKLPVSHKVKSVVLILSCLINYWIQLNTHFNFQKVKGRRKTTKHQQNNSIYRVHAVTLFVPLWADISVNAWSWLIKRWAKWIMLLASAMKKERCNALYPVTQSNIL